MPRPDGRINEGEPAGSSDDLVTGAQEATQLSRPDAAADVTRLSLDAATRLSGGDVPASRGEETRLGASEFADADATRLGTREFADADADATRLGTREFDDADAEATRLGAREFDDADATRLIDADATRLGESDLTVLGPASRDDDTTPVHPGSDALTPPFSGGSRPPSTGSGRRPPTGTSGTRRPRTSAGPRGGRGSAQGPIEVGQGFGDRYHIIRVLGVGGMGAVYQAWDAELGVAVALKVIRPEITADPAAASDIERRFKRELLLARQVTHPNVVRIHDLGDIDGIKYITMPFVDGADLATILSRDTKLPVPRALRIARGIVSGLVAAHQAGVVHRDLKPANIMVGADDVPTIMDFGIARSAGGPGQSKPPVAGVAPADLSRTAALAASATVAGTIVGTVAYMAPEQAKGQEADQRADIYALGLILYDMLIGGRRSERAASAVAELQERMEQAPPAPRTIDAEIPEAVDAIIRRCLEPDPGKRFQTTVELEAALARLDDNGKPLPMIRRLTRRTMITSAAAVLLLLGGTFYVTKWLSAPVRDPDPVSVVIADVRNETGDATFDNTIPQTLRRALEDASFISAFDRSKLPNVGVARVPEKLDEVAAREVAVKQGVGVVLASAIAPGRNGYEISVKVTQAVTGNEITSSRDHASSKEQVLETAATLMARVRKALGDRTSESDQLFAMRSVSASSLEVVSHYAAGMEAQARGNFEAARNSLARAVELDPNFGLGYQGLSAMSGTLGRPDDAKAQIQEALRHVDGMTEREKFFTRGAYFRLIRDYRNCAKEYGELLSRYPADSVARAQRAACLVFLRKTPEAFQEMQQAVKMLPNHVAFRINLALIANRAGEFQLVEDQVRAMPQPDPRALLALAYSQMARGMPREAAETYKKIAAMDPRHPWAQAGLADVLVYEGRFSEAIPIFEQSAAADVAAKSTTRAAHKLLSAAYAHLQRGQNESATAVAGRALQQSTVTIVRFLAAQIFVESGAIDKAQALAAELSKSTEPSDDARVYGKIVDAQLALKKKDSRQAIKILTDANSVLDTWLGRFTLGRAYLDAGDLVQADSEFDVCITRRGEVLAVVDEGPTYGLFPIVYYYRGLVREGMNTASFADSYREYLKIRGESTEDPLVPEVRKRVGQP